MKTLAPWSRTHNKEHLLCAIVLLCKGQDQITERYVAFKYDMLPRLIRKEIINLIEHQQYILKNNHTTLKKPYNCRQ